MSVHLVIEKHLLHDRTACGRTSSSAATSTRHIGLVTCTECLALQPTTSEARRNEPNTDKETCP